MTQCVPRPAPPLDPNKTVWQRLNEQLLNALDGDHAMADKLTASLHPYVVAERNAVKSPSR